MTSQGGGGGTENPKIAVFVWRYLWTTLSVLIELMYIYGYQKWPIENGFEHILKLDARKYQFSFICKLIITQCYDEREPHFIWKNSKQLVQTIKLPIQKTHDRKRRKSKYKNA